MYYILLNFFKDSTRKKVWRATRIGHEMRRWSIFLSSNPLARGWIKLTENDPPPPVTPAHVSATAIKNSLLIDSFQSCMKCLDSHFLMRIGIFHGHFSQWKWGFCLKTTLSWWTLLSYTFLITWNFWHRCLGKVKPGPPKEISRNLHLAIFCIPSRNSNKDRCKNLPLKNVFCDIIEWHHNFP